MNSSMHLNKNGNNIKKKKNHLNMMRNLMTMKKAKMVGINRLKLLKRHRMLRLINRLINLKNKLKDRRMEKQIMQP
jgi:hypothetical protein